jgi:hypothetical protein
MKSLPLLAAGVLQVLLNPPADMGNRVVGKFVRGSVEAEIERCGALRQLAAKFQVLLA